MNILIGSFLLVLGSSNIWEYFHPYINPFTRETDGPDLTELIFGVLFVILAVVNFFLGF